MKIGLDIHGVIDAKPEFFAALSSLLVYQGHEVHIITGPPKSDELVAELKGYGMEWTHFFSIVSHNESIGTPMTYDEKGHAHMEPYLWDKTKADYCLRMGIDLHLDDSDAYGYFFKTPYARFYSKDSNRVKKTEL